MHCSFEPLVTLPPFSCVASWRRSVGRSAEKREERKASKTGRGREKTDGRTEEEVYPSVETRGRQQLRQRRRRRHSDCPPQPNPHSFFAEVGLGRSVGRSASVGATTALIAASGAPAIVANEGQSMRLPRRRRRHSSAASLPPSLSDQPRAKVGRFAGRSVGRSNGLGTK